MSIKRTASKVTQGDLVLYTTSLRVKDLKTKNFYQIETLDSADRTGYQRILNEARAKRLAEYLLDANKNREAFLPTSIFLATDKQLPFDNSAHVLTIDTEEIGPFNVVDGQHRIRGLVLAAEADPSMENFEVPVNIGVGLDAISQMCHFLIVNTTQRSVDEAIEQQIVARLTEMIDVEKTPVLPRWIKRQVEKGEDQRALAITSFLTADAKSPWKNKIKMANSDDDSGSATVTQKSFVKSIKKYLLVPSNPFSGQDWTVERQQKVLMNYWGAIASLLVDPDDEEASVVFKTNGLHLFHMVSPTMFLHLADRRDYKRDVIESVLRGGFSNLATEFLEITSPEFWRRGGKASGLNQAAMRKYAQGLATAINATKGSGEVAL